jgi:hypothetical protein
MFVDDVALVVLPFALQDAGCNLDLLDRLEHLQFLFYFLVGFDQRRPLEPEIMGDVAIEVRSQLLQLLCLSFPLDHFGDFLQDFVPLLNGALCEFSQWHLLGVVANSDYLR